MHGLATQADPQLGNPDAAPQQVARFGAGGVANIEVGIVELEEGQLEVAVEFAHQKISGGYIFTHKYVRDTSAAPQDIRAVVNSQSVDGFVMKLSAAPNTENCTLHWGVAIVDGIYFSSEAVPPTQYVPDVNLVHLTGNETVDGHKIFSGDLTPPASTVDALGSAEPAGRIKRLTDGAAAGAIVTSDGVFWVGLLSKSAKVYNPCETPFNTPNDDTGDASIGLQDAVDEAAATGAIVQPPPGIYRRESGVIIHRGVQFICPGWGYTNAISPNGPSKGAWFHIVDDDFVPFTFDDLVSGASLKNFGMYWDQPAPAPGWAPTIYPYAIEIGDVGDIFLDNILMMNPSHGIHQNSNDGTKIAGRINMERIFGQPFVNGVKLETCLDVNFFQKVHFWTYWSNNANVLAYMKEHGLGFRLGRVDNTQFNDIFGFSYNTLFSFEGTPEWEGVYSGGSSNCAFVSIGADLCNQMAGIAQSNMVGSQWAILHGGSAPGFAFFNVEGDNNEIIINGLRTLGDRFLLATGDNNTIKVNGAVFDTLSPGNTDKIIQNTGDGNDITISNYKSVADRDAFHGGNRITVFGGNLGFKWIDVTPQTGWTNAGGANDDLSYAYNDNWIYLQGLILSGGTTAPDTLLGALPAGHFPPKNVTFLVPSNGTAKPVYVNTGGQIRIGGVASGTDLDLNGIRFRLN